jgi:hypothetical protein
MQLRSIIDPRDSLEKATRWELIDFAKANGIDVPDDAPALYTMDILRAHGLTNIKVPDRPLGLYAGSGIESKPDAKDDFLRQYEAEKKGQDVSAIPMHQLRSLLKSKGIKFSRKDKLQTLREKLSG